MARVELPQSRLKIRKRRRLVRMAWRIPLAIIVAVLIVGGLLAWGSHAPFLRVNAFSISGEQTISAVTLEQFAQQEIAGSYLYLFAKDDILLYPQAKISADLIAQYPQIKSVDVHAADFHTVAINIVERQPVALWCMASSTSCYLMDEDGVVYQPAEASSSLYVTYEGTTTGGALPMQYLTAQQFQSLFALTNALSQKLGTTTVTDVSVDTSGDVEATFNDGFILKFALADAGGDVFQNFGLALQSDIFKSHSLDDFEYLDLRFGQKLYYMLKQ
jgi:cell division septal protein FtsQ